MVKIFHEFSPLFAELLESMFPVSNMAISHHNLEIRGHTRNCESDFYATLNQPH